MIFILPILLLLMLKLKDQKYLVTIPIVGLITAIISLIIKIDLNEYLVPNSTNLYMAIIISLAATLSLVKKYEIDLKKYIVVIGFIGINHWYASIIGIIYLLKEEADTKSIFSNIILINIMILVLLSLTSLTEVYLEYSFLVLSILALLFNYYKISYNKLCMSLLSLTSLGYFYKTNNIYILGVMATMLYLLRCEIMSKGYFNKTNKYLEKLIINFHVKNKIKVKETIRINVKKKPITHLFTIKEHKINSSFLTNLFALFILLFLCVYVLDGGLINV